MHHLSQLKVRLTIPFLLIILFTFIQFGWVVLQETWQLIIQAELDNVALVSAAATNYLSEQQALEQLLEHDELFEQVGQLTGYEFILVTDKAVLPEAFSAETIAAAFSSPQRYVQPDGSRHVVMASELVINQRPAKLLVTSSLEDGVALLILIFAKLGFGLLMSTGMICLAGWFIARFITEELRDVEAMTAAIAAGDFEQRIDIKTHDELGRLGDSINKMASKLHEFRHSKAQFLGQISHELRTPLAIIRGYSGLILEDEPHAKSAPTQRIILTQAERLTRLVDDLLQLAQIDAGKLSLNVEPTNVLELLHKARDAFALVSQEQDVGLSMRNQLSPHFEIYCDAHRIGQVITILLTNALKHSPTESAIELSCWHDTQLCISVADKGSGVPESELPHIFERFYQADKSTPGVGLGLAIAQELVQSHGGAISAENQYPGCKFTISLPIKPSSQLQEEAQHERSSNSALPHLHNDSARRLNHRPA